MKMSRLAPDKYLKLLIPQGLFGSERTRRILKASQSVVPTRVDAEKVQINVYDYNTDSIQTHELQTVEETFIYKQNGLVTWINIDGIRKADVEKVCAHFEVHSLTAEDILSLNQRPKMDE